MSPEKQRAAQLIAEGYNHQEAAREVSVTDRTMRRWRTDAEFANEVYARCSRLLIDTVPAVFNVLVEKAKQGDYQAIKLYFDRIDKAQEYYYRTNNPLELAHDAGSMTFTWGKE